MKPNFALSLSFDGIRLLHRAAGGWHLVGEADVSDPDLNDILSELRQAADAIKSGPVRTKLIIPDEQIKYLSIDTPGMDDDARRAAAAQALDGATPYPVDALSFDISPDGERTHVAAVARETLAEAEAFANDHGFNPVSFVAAASSSDFLGEPFFGPTVCAPSLLGAGETVEPDGVRVVVVERPADEVEATPEPVQPEPTTPEPEPVAEAPAPVRRKAAVPDTSDDSPDMTRPKAVPVVIETKAEQEDTLPDPSPSDETTLPPPLTAKADGEPEPSEADTSDSDSGETTTPPLLGFATRRRQNPASNPTPAKLGGVSREITPSKTSPPVAPPAPAAAAAAKDAPSINLTAPPKSAADSLRPEPRLGEAAPERTIPPAGAAPKGKSSIRQLGGFLSRRKPSAKAAAVTPAPRKGSKAAKQAASESERMTIFGARDSVQVGGKPRFLGLILTAVLLIFLAGVAAWAAVFMEEGLARFFQPRERTLASTLPEDARDSLALDVGATTQLEPDPEEEADGVVVAALNDGLTDDVLSAEDAAVLDALRNPLPDPIAPEDLDASELEARYAVTGIWPRAPDMNQPADVIEIEDLYVTGIDPISPALDAVALPTAASFDTDGNLALVTSPVAAGTNFARGPDGRVIPTPEGALSPDGFTVILGSPPAKPPATFVRLSVEPDAAAPDLIALARVRPNPRPSDLVEQNERAKLGGLSRDELAALRPQLRPAAPQDVVTPEPEVATEEAETPEEAAPVSALAAATSLRPATRPRNFTRIVARATRLAPEPEAEPERTASVAPRTVTPSIPSSTSVAKAATVRNAIKLNNINLIGVYGTPSNRRALVRLGNGRYKKLVVGDRFDGGRVSAIGDSELRYQKGNRSVILKMPRG